MSKPPKDFKETKSQSHTLYPPSSLLSPHLADGGEGESGVESIYLRAQQHRAEHDAKVVRVHAIGLLALDQMQEAEEVEKRECVRGREVVKGAEEEAEGRIEIDGFLNMTISDVDEKIEVLEGN